jgi:hypothetical protein
LVKFEEYYTWNRRFEINLQLAQSACLYSHILDHSGLIPYQAGLLTRGRPAKRANKMPTHIDSWFTDPRAPRISVGETCNCEHNMSNISGYIHSSMAEINTISSPNIETKMSIFISTENIVILAIQCN